MYFICFEKKNQYSEYLKNFTKIKLFLYFFIKIETYLIFQNFDFLEKKLL